MNPLSGTDARFTERALRLHQFDVGALSLRVAIWPGKDKHRTPILLFNGIGGNMELLSPFVDALGEDVEVIMFDMPGIGGSSAPLRFYRMKTLVRLAVHVLKKAGHQRADVVGVSWGGALAQQFAYTAASRCRRLVLCATMAGLPIAWPPSLRLAGKMLTPQRYLRRDYMLKSAGHLYGGRFRVDQELVRAYASRIKKPSVKGYLMQLMAISGWTSVLWLWRLRQPTLVLSGVDDPLVPTLNAHILARLIPHTQLEILDDGHLFLIAQPLLSARYVREFLDVGTHAPDAQKASNPWATSMHTGT